MERDSMVCPNCGNELATHRRDTQNAGRRVVLLHWVICASCRHVALEGWTFVEPAAASSSSERSDPSEG
ncbi:MAG TPA: hypothetical protein VF221_08705 [Chloroflexota bacterium]